MTQSRITECCEECKVSIHADPKHFMGNPVDDAEILKCILYDMFSLALAIQALARTDWPPSMRYELFPPQDSKHKGGQFDPDEALKIAALVKIRILYDFLYNPCSGDDFQALPLSQCGRTQNKLPQDFSQYGVDGSRFTNKSEIDRLADEKTFTKKSVSKYVAHLVEERILKPECIPQLKFTAGRKTVTKVALLVLEDALRFVEQVVEHTDFPGHTDWGTGYEKATREAIGRITNASSKSS